MLTSLLCEDGVRSSYFLLVKISTPTKWHFACPCFPVLEVETSTTYTIRASSQPICGARTRNREASNSSRVLITKAAFAEQQIIRMSLSHHLAGPVLDHNESILSDGSGLLRVGGGGSCISAVEMDIVMFFSHCAIYTQEPPERG